MSPKAQSLFRQSKKPFRLTLVLLLAISLGACASTSRNKSADNTDKPSQKIKRVDWEESEQSASEPRIESALSPKELAIYNRIKHEYASKNYDEALEMIMQFKRDFKNSPAEDRILNYEGLIHYIKQSQKWAIAAFEKAIKVGSDERYRNYIFFNLASTYYEASKGPEASHYLEKVRAVDLDFATRTKYYALRAKILADLNQPFEASRGLLLAMRTLQKASPLKIDKVKTYIRLEDSLRTQLGLIAEPDLISDLISDNENSRSSEHLLFRLAETKYRNQSFGRAENEFREHIEQYPNSRYTVQIQDYLRAIKNQGVINPKAVGVLLPITGKFAEYGQIALNGIEMAFGLYNGAQNQNQFQLIIEDSGETEEDAVAALDRLFFDHHVIAVIGPLTSKGIEKVSQRSADLGLPMISLSQQRGIRHPYVFYSAITPIEQAKAIAKYAVETLQLKRFAMLYPDDNFGKPIAESFWTAIEEEGKEIVGSESYPSEETDFKIPVDKISGLYYKDARKWELDKLETLRKEEKITRRNHRTEQYYRLPPIVDFDAVFIPDAVRNVSMILPTFTYRDIENVRFLGISTWNSPILLERAGKEAEGAVFCDAFYAQSKNPIIQTFVSQFQNEFGYTPSATEAMSFDAAAILERVLTLSGSSIGRSKVRSMLSDVDQFRGVSGTIRFDDGNFKRDLKILAVQGRKVVEIN